MTRLSVIGTLVSVGCADRTVSPSISDDGLTPQQRSSGQVSRQCVIHDDALKCWYLEPHPQNQALLMLRDELEPVLPLPEVDLGASGPVTSFSTEFFDESRCAALRGEGVKCWGSNGVEESDTYPQLGQPGPALVLGDDADERGAGLPFVSLGASDVEWIVPSYHGSCAVFASRRVKCWGPGRAVLGLGDDEARGDEVGEMGDNLPYVNLGSDFQLQGVAGQLIHLCAWSVDGRVKCWGDNELSALGTQPSDPIGDDPGEMGDALPYVELGEDFFVVQVAVGVHHSCALSDDGKVKCWGANADVREAPPNELEPPPPNNFGRLGLGDRMVSRPATGDSLPTVDLGSEGGPVVAIAAGDDHNCALFDNGKVKCWGNGGAGRLGYESRESIGDDPGEMGDALPFVDLGGRTAIKLGCESGRSCVLTDDDHVLCWGSIGGEDGTYRPGAEPGTMGEALIPVATPEELGRFAD